jgi:hypothetical protein
MGMNRVELEGTQEDLRQLAVVRVVGTDEGNVSLIETGRVVPARGPFQRIGEAAQAPASVVAIETHESEDPMDAACAGQVLGMLARWAVRRARKDGRLSPGGSGEVVTVDFSKGSGNGISDN